MTNITVFTPTFNRAHTLQRVYSSLLNQTDKEFLWLIIDDGSTDNTKVQVNSWQKEGQIEIEYQFKENGGKHTAMKLAYELAKTKYILALDSDDELTPDAVEKFRKEWERIEVDGLGYRFAEVSGLSYSKNGKLIGNFYFPEGTEYIDSYWHEMVLKYQNNNEHVVCWNTDKLRECVRLDEDIWLSEKISFLGESVLWARIGKKYKTRYIDKCLRIYHYDAGESLLRTTNYTKAHYASLVGNKYFLDENLNYFLWNPKYFNHLILKFIISGIELRISPIEILRNIQTTRFRVFYLVFLPIGFLTWAYFKFIKRKFWF